MRKYPIVAIAAALMFAGLTAPAVAQDAGQKQAARSEPSQFGRAKQDVKQGAREAGREVNAAAKTAGREIKHAAKETEAGARQGWQGFKHAAGESWRSVKGFFSRLFSG